MSGYDFLNFSKCFIDDAGKPQATVQRQSLQVDRCRSIFEALRPGRPDADHGQFDSWYGTTRRLVPAEQRVCRPGRSAMRARL